MKRSENSCSPWSTRIVSCFEIMRTVVGRVGVAVAMRIDWPVRQPSPKKSPGQKRHNYFFASPIYNTQPDATFLNVHDVGRGITLPEDGLFGLKLADLSTDTGRVEKQFHIEMRFL